MDYVFNLRCISGHKKYATAAYNSGFRIIEIKKIGAFNESGKAVCPI